MQQLNLLMNGPNLGILDGVLPGKVLKFLSVHCSTSDEELSRNLAYHPCGKLG